MSRHRHIRNINVEEELLEDDDRDYFGKSMEEEPMSPSVSHFLYRRNQQSMSYDPEQTIHEDDYECDEDDYDGDVFDMDDVSFKPKASKNTKSAKPKAPVTTKKANFIIGGEESPKAVPKAVQLPQIEHLKVSEPKSKSGTLKASSQLTPNSSFHQLSALEVALNSSPVFKQRERPAGGKECINLIVAGHVDAGKSTLVGHLLYLTGNVEQKAMNKYKQQSTRVGKGSFAFAWIMDETDEERERGVTIDVGHASFDTKAKHFNLLDSPGHHDFIPNMVAGASQADAAVLVVCASRGEFERGFDEGGQTREHSLLLRSLGVRQLIVAVNKMDSVDWDEGRMLEIQSSLGPFLKKQAGFNDIVYVPVSGLGGENLTALPEKTHPLMSWYKGECLVDTLDHLEAAVAPVDRPLRLVVTDVFRCAENAVSLVGKIETGFIEVGNNVFIMPKADAAVVKSVALADASTESTGVCFAGDQVALNLSGSFEPDSVFPGCVICRGGKELIIPAQHLLVKLITFENSLPILKGTKAELFVHSLRVPCTVVKLRAILNKQTGEVAKEHPRIIAKGMSALVEIKTDRPISAESDAQCKPLARLNIRINGRTVAAGVIKDILPQ